MKAFVLLATCLFFSIITFGQNRVSYHENTFDKTFKRCKQPPSFGADSLDLQKYLADKIQNQISRTEGQIEISVLIDTTGKPLCEWIENNSSFKMNKIKLDVIIDSMPYWNCGEQNGYKADCAELIVLTFNRKDLGVTYRIGIK